MYDAGYDKLTGRETEILRLMVGGLSNGEIASALRVAEGTVKNHVPNILSKLVSARCSRQSKPVTCDRAPSALVGVDAKNLVYGANAILESAAGVLFAVQFRVTEGDLAKPLHDHLAGTGLSVLSIIETRRLG